MYYISMTIVNEDSRVIAKLETLLTDEARVVIYDRHMFIVQATGWIKKSVINWTQVCQLLVTQVKTQLDKRHFGGVNVA